MLTAIKAKGPTGWSQVGEQADGSVVDLRVSAIESVRRVTVSDKSTGLANHVVIPGDEYAESIRPLSASSRSPDPPGPVTTDAALVENKGVPGVIRTETDPHSYGRHK